MGNYYTALTKEYGNVRSWINAGLIRFRMDSVRVGGIGMKSASYECVVKEFGFLARWAISNSAAGNELSTHSKSLR